MHPGTRKIFNRTAQLTVGCQFFFAEYLRIRTKADSPFPYKRKSPPSSRFIVMGVRSTVVAFAELTSCTEACSPLRVGKRSLGAFQLKSLEDKS